MVPIIQYNSTTMCFAIIYSVCGHPDYMLFCNPNINSYMYKTDNIYLCTVVYSSVYTDNNISLFHLHRHLVDK